MGIKKLDWYIIKKFLSTFFFAIMVLAVISCVIDYSEKVDNIVSKKAPLLTVVNYYKNFIPHITALLFPLFIFIATIFFTSKIAYKSEIIAILASGISFQRFLRPYLIGGGFLCLVSLIANHWLIPRSEEHTSELQSRGLISYAVFCLKKKTKHRNRGNSGVGREPRHRAASAAVQ